MTAHTKGPWTTQDMGTGWIVGPGTIDGADYVADVHRHTDGMTDAEAEANARLVSAAPELLEALRRVVEEFPLDPNAEDDSPYDVHQCEAIHGARAAIAKAAGK